MLLLKETVRNCISEMKNCESIVLHTDSSLALNITVEIGSKLVTIIYILIKFELYTRVNNVTHDFAG